jgi:hypothetical protein
MFVTWVLFEVSFPVGFVVSSIVTFVLIPHAKRTDMPTDNFFVIIPILMHNVNIVFMALEIIVNRIPFSLWHFPFILLYGICYGVFSWVFYHYYGFYHYFFLNYDRKGAIYWYIALMVIIGGFFILGYAFSTVVNNIDSIVPSIVSTSHISCIASLF